MNKIKNLQIAYAVILLVGVVEAFLLPEEFVDNDAKTLYWMNLYAIVSGFGAMYFTLRMFVFRRIKSSVSQADEEAGLLAFCKWTKVRLAVLALALWSNVALYFASSYTETPKYCVLIVLVAFVFCWPSATAFKSLRQEVDDKP